MKTFVIVFGIAIVLLLTYLMYSSKNPTVNNWPLPISAFDQKYEGQGTIDAYTYNSYTNHHTPWRSSGIPHAPITFRPDNADQQDYGSQNIIKWDLEKNRYYFPYRNYNDYGLFKK